MRDDGMIEQFRVPVDEYVRRSEENLELYEEQRGRSPRASALEIERSLEYASLIIHSMVTGEPRVIYGNVRNERADHEPARGRCVEVPCLVDRTRRAADRRRGAAAAAGRAQPHLR